MQIGDYSDSEEEQYGGADGFDTSDDEDAVPPNAHGADEQNDFLSSDDSEADSDDDGERDTDEEEAIYDDHVETIREFVQPCPSLQTQGWATEFTFRTFEDDNRIEDIAELVNV